jgi:hypothetical protein
MLQQQQTLTHIATAPLQQGQQAGQAGTLVQAAGPGRLLVTLLLLLLLGLAARQ